MRMAAAGMLAKKKKERKKDSVFLFHLFIV